MLLENVRFLAAYRRPAVVPEAEVEQAWEQAVHGEELVSCAGSYSLVVV
ncbi:hypothetical protein [Streptomyces noursei]